MKRLEEKLVKFGIRPGLERIEKICEALGRPQDKMKVILVTGTNGKGSVVADLASMLTEAGFRTGAYLSPHIVRYNERFKIDGKEITDDEFEPYERELLGMHERGYEMTLFEALTAIAYKYFAEKGCEYAVVEIGMGGRYDATNIVEEEMAVITSVDLEHTDYLGSTVSEIARDKSHIIKNPRGVAVTGCAGEALMEVKKRAEETGTPLRTLGEDFGYTLLEARMDGTVFDFSGKRDYRKLFVPLAGRHQAFNAALAVAAAEELGLDEKAIRDGLGKVEHPGRLQVIGEKPLVVADGAHNPDGIRTLVKSLDIYPRKKLVCVFSALRDKDWQAMLSVLAPECDEVVVNQMGGERAEDAEDIAAEAKRYTKAEVVRDIGESVRTAKERAGKDGMVLICGSLYMLGEAMGKRGGFS
jgi:dihydrofolate synthase/folylpolyglutamate synthase